MSVADSRLRRGVYALLAVLLGSASARAGENATVAQSLFDEAIVLMKAGNYESACPKLRESLRLDPAGGTALNLAFCLEKNGQLASAYTAYKDAQHQATIDRRPDREATAKEHAQALADRMPKVAIETGGQHVDVTLDGIGLGEPSFGTPIAVDPGHHEISAASPGHRSWSDAFEVAASSGVTTIRVPVLAAVEASGPSSNPVVTHSQTERSTGTATAGVGLWIGAGVALLGGAGFGVAAKTTHDKAGCDGTCKSERAYGLEEDANRYAWVSNGAFIAGLVAAGVGTVLYLAFPRSKLVASAAPGLRW